jgi:hypothetical protein
VVRNVFLTTPSALQRWLRTIFLMRSDPSSQRRGIAAALTVLFPFGQRLSLPIECD